MGVSSESQEYSEDGAAGTYSWDAAAAVAEAEGEVEGFVNGAAANRTDASLSGLRGVTATCLSAVFSLRRSHRSYVHVVFMGFGKETGKASCRL